MTHAQNDIIIRTITGPGELDLFCALDYVFDDELADDLASGRRRPQWMWVALRGEHLVARAAWWGSVDDAAPSLLDILDVADDPDRIDMGVRLLKAALSEIIPAGTQGSTHSTYACDPPRLPGGPLGTVITADPARPEKEPVSGSANGPDATIPRRAAVPARRQSGTRDRSGTLNLPDDSRE